jgi:uncharacterized protein (TIGR02594 family)
LDLFPEEVRMNVTPYMIAERYIGVHERTGGQDHPFIQHCFSLCGFGLDTPDEVPWCAAFIQHPFWELRCPRSKSARAREGLLVGKVLTLGQALVGFDVVILKRGTGEQPGPDVIDAPGHIGLFAGMSGAGHLYLLAGNQGNRVSVASFPVSDILGIRRWEA